MAFSAFVAEGQICGSCVFRHAAVDRCGKQSHLSERFEENGTHSESGVTVKGHGCHNVELKVAVQNRNHLVNFQLHVHLNNVSGQGIVVLVD